MNQPWAYMAAAAAEFPNDNPALHDGAIWVCLRVSGPPRAVVRARNAARAAEAPRAEAPLQLAVETDALPALAPFPEPMTTAVTVPTIELATTSTVEAAVATALEAVAAQTNEAVTVREERLPDSVLGELLESLELDLSPTASSGPESATLSEEALDLEPLGAILTALVAEEFVFDGGDAEGAVDLAAQDLESGRDALVAAVGETSVAGSSAPSSVPSRKPDHAESDAYTAFVAAVVQVALEAGATRAAALLPKILDGSAIDKDTCAGDVRQALLSAKVLEERSTELVANPEFFAMSGAWRSVLRGETNDLGACGTSTLDVWGADLLKALGVGASGKVDVRRELRRRGVAAFGMLLAA